MQAILGNLAKFKTTLGNFSGFGFALSPLGDNYGEAPYSCVKLQSWRWQDVCCTGAGYARTRTTPCLIRLRLNGILLCEAYRRCRAKVRPHKEKSRTCCFVDD